MTTEPTTAISRQRRPRGRYPKTQDGAAPKREKRIPEYLEADEMNAIGIMNESNHRHNPLLHCTSENRKLNV